MEEDFEKIVLDYIKKCISEEINFIRESKRKLEGRIDTILFGEGGMSADRVEKCLFPFEQSGYLTTEQKLDLLLYKNEKSREKGEDIRLLDEWIKKGISVVTEKEISESYIKWRRSAEFFFSWEEKKEFLVRRFAEQLGVGLVGILLRLGGDAIAIGEYCSYHGKIESRLEVRKGEYKIALPCLEFDSEEEIECVIRRVIEGEKKGEITRINPCWKSERQDGTRLMAIRPPATDHWGLEIIFGNGEEKKIYGR